MLGRLSFWLIVYAKASLNRQIGGKLWNALFVARFFSKSSKDVVQRKRKCFPELKKRVYPEELLGCPEKEVRIKG